MASWRSWLCVVTASVLFLTAVTHAFARDGPYTGRLLRDIIEETRKDVGADIVYSNGLVNATQAVKREPLADQPIAILRELLSDHGLDLKKGGDTWYVVPGERPEAGRNNTTLVIFVRDFADRIRVSGARIEFDDESVRFEKLVEGAFQASDIAPGNYTIRVTAPSYHDETMNVIVASGQTDAVTLDLRPTSETHLENIVVSTSRYEIMRSPQPSLSQFDQEAMQTMPNIGGDPLRMMRRLPGAASGGLSARVHFRGGEDDETLLVLDGLELVDPFHLRDYQSVFSTIDQRILANVDVYTGGFPASYGDALSGVIAMRSFEPVELAHEIAVSFFNTSVLSSGTFAHADGEWLVSARRGNLDLVIDRIDSSLGNPDYQDAFAHVGYRLSDRAQLSLNVFAASDDVLVVTEAVLAEREEAQSDTDNTHLWVTLENEWTPNLYSQTLVSRTDLEDFRRGFSNDLEAVVGQVEDRRKLRTLAIKQDWTWRSGSRHQTRWGLRWARLDADYDYQAQAEFLELPAELAGEPPPIDRRSVFSIDGEELNAYLSHRLVPSRKWLAEFGLRWDKQTYTIGREQWSPRVNLLYRINASTDVRLSAGRFHQSQQIQDLQVEEGVETFFPAERADQIILGFEHRFDNEVRLRVEAYKKSLRRLQPRYENLFNPLVILPELSPDRVRIAPDRANVKGLEVYASYDDKGPLSWWSAYSLSRATDRLAGRNVARSWDQRHALSAGVTWQSKRWEASIAGAWRSGWPTTHVSLVDVPGEDEPVATIGERNAENLGDFATLDVHIARHFGVGATRVTVFLDIINLLDRKNPCCVEYDLVEATDGSEFLFREVEHWLPRVPSLGVRWQF